MEACADTFQYFLETLEAGLSADTSSSPEVATGAGQSQDRRRGPLQRRRKHKKLLAPRGCRRGFPK